jgi:c-di-GMP-binding flagellar brake protein YcgR
MFKKPKRRKFVRLKTHCLLKYKGIGDREVLSFIRDISAGGVLFHSKQDIPVGSILELSINFSPSPRSIKTRAKVLRVKLLKKVKGVDMAVEFINLDNKAKSLINHKILEICKVQGKDLAEGQGY